MLFLSGGSANLIVAGQAARLGVFLTWRKGLNQILGLGSGLGLLVTLATFAVTALWLWLR